MPIQYQPFPEFQVPNVNILGALAQGQASALQETQAQKLAQQMESAAAKDVREEEKTQFELASKKYDSLIDMAPRLNAKNYGAWYKQVTETFPLAAATLSPTYDPQTVSMLGLKGADLKPQVLQQHFGDTSRFIRVGATGGAEVVPGSEVTAPSYMEAGGEVYRKTPQGLVPAPIISGEGMPGERQNLAAPLVENFEGFRPTPYFDVNADRVGFGSSTVTREDGTVEKVRKGMAPITKDDARRDLNRRLETEFIPKAAAKVGEENWSRLPENTRAALTSVAYNYGNIPSRIVPAVQSGNPEAIAKAIESLAGDNKGVNAGRRMQEANIARGTGLPGSQAVPAFAAGGLPTFMGGPQIQPPINMMGAAPINAMAAPQPLPPVAPAAPIPAPQPATVGTRKQIKGQANIDKTLDKMMGTYEQLLTSGDMISSKTATADPLGTLGRYLKGTTVGQETEKALGSKAQDRRNRISALRGQLLQDIKEATGQTSKELDSNFELKTALERLGDPTMSIESIRAIVSDISSRYGSGKIKLPEEDAAPIAPAAPAAPPSNRPPLSSFYTR
jgi:GH24 family phage-related lysozyme (muramidase)